MYLSTTPRKACTMFVWISKYVVMKLFRSFLLTRLHHVVKPLMSVKEMVTGFGFHADHAQFPCAAKHLHDRPRDVLEERVE